MRFDTAQPVAKADLFDFTHLDVAVLQLGFPCGDARAIREIHDNYGAT